MQKAGSIPRAISGAWSGQGRLSAEGRLQGLQATLRAWTEVSVGS